MFYLEFAGRLGFEFYMGGRRKNGIDRRSVRRLRGTSGLNFRIAEMFRFDFREGRARRWRCGGWCLRGRRVEEDCDSMSSIPLIIGGRSNGSGAIFSVSSPG